MFRSRSWFGGSLWRNKNPHSLDHLKYLYNVLSKNRTVSENNRGLLVETLRSIAEILIWGDQNDSSVFDFFLEKNMLSFFLKILKQKCGSYVCVQLLQTLNILFENIRNETSLYYLLSNNHVNSIIVHKFDFSDEEVMAYYISFLKTLSLKLNCHTIHFFYNDHTNDFPLYTEAIKFFNHPESMVRIAVRTLTLNVYRVEDHSMLRFIRNKTAAPYFSNLVWFIGNHVLELDSCVRNDADHSSQSRLSDLVAEHLDHLHYLNDILSLNIEELNDVLVDHLLNKLFIPLYIFSLLPSQAVSEQDAKPSISSVVSLFLLSQVFLITRQKPLVHDLAQVILQTTTAHWDNGDFVTQTRPVFVAPKQSLEESLELNSASNSVDKKPDEISEDISNLNITDEEKEQRLAQDSVYLRRFSSSQLMVLMSQFRKRFYKCPPILPSRALPSSEGSKVFLDVVMGSLDCQENDYAALFALCLLYAMSQNSGIEPGLISGFVLPASSPEGLTYNPWLVQKLISIISASCQTVSKVRIVTLELAICLLLRLVFIQERSLLTDAHLAGLLSAKEESAALLRNYYKMVDQQFHRPYDGYIEPLLCSGALRYHINKCREEMFGEMFENEDEELRRKPLNVEWLMMDSNVLLPPTGTPLTGIDFAKRLPCGEVERARRAIRVFLLIRALCMKLSGEQETQLPLTNRTECIQNDTALNLTNSDLLSCHVIGADGVRNHRFLVVESNQIILVVPVPGQLGYGRPKMAALLHDLDVTGDKQDSRSLYISAKHTTIGPMHNAKFIFDDSIRCMAAQQRLTKGRLKAREEKMRQLERLLDIPVTDSPSYNLLHQLRHHHRSQGGRLLSHRLPGFATPVRIPSTSPRHGRESDKDKGDSSSTGSRSRESSPKTPKISPKLPRPRSEEIQLQRITSKRGSLESGGGESGREGGGPRLTQPTGSGGGSEEEGPVAAPAAGPSLETSFAEPPLSTPPPPLPPTSSSETLPKKKGKVEVV